MIGFTELGTTQITMGEMFFLCRHSTNWLLGGRMQWTPCTSNKNTNHNTHYKENIIMQFTEHFKSQLILLHRLKLYLRHEL